jgi:hypothetical protein
MIAVAGMALAALATTGNPGTFFTAFASAEVFLFFAFVGFLLRFAMIRSSLSPVPYGKSVPARVGAGARLNASSE